MEDYRVKQTGDEIQEIFNQSPVDTADIAELKEATTSLDGRLEAVEGKIPSGASSENPLTDKQYVDSSIASASATFRGTYNEVTDLELTTEATHAEIGEALASVIDTADSNDYCFVQIPTADATPTEIESIERYKFVTGTGWQYEYTLNNSGFTADQWAAINSGITTGLVAKLTDLPTNAELNTLLNGKANAADVYTKSETYTKTELDTQLGAKANSADVYPKTDTYTKQEVDALITTPEVQYVTVTATSDTTSVTDVLPATGAANTIYRVGSWDGTQYDDGVYSEYSWNGSAYILLDVKNYGLATGSDFNNPTSAQRSLVTTVGSVLDGMPEGVFDVSARNSGSTWASLSALLSDADLDTLIPASWRKGGMSIRFVCSSDNKYVQYLYNGTSTAVADFTNTDNWEKVNLEEEVSQLETKVTGLDSYSFTASTGEHTRFMDMHPVNYVAGTTLKGRLSLGTAEFDGTALAVFLIAEDGTTAIESKNITMGQEFEIRNRDNNASFISFYIWRVTTAGTFLVDLQYGGMQKQIDAQNEEISNVESLVYSGFNNGAYAIGGTEISGVETIDNCLLLWDSGKPHEYVSPSWKVKKYPVTSKTNYHIVGSTQYENAIFSVINSSDSVIYKEKGATDGQEIIDKIYQTPEGAAYIYVAYVTTIKEGVLTNIEIAPIEEPPTPGKWTGKKWAVIGDSLTEVNSRTTKHYFDYIAEKTGISVVNMGLSGSGYRKMFDTNQAFYQRVANVPTDADVITIFGSFNDLSVADYDLGTPADTGVDTICGCINNTLDTILSVYMNAEKVPTIGVITPTPWIGTGPADPTNSSSLYCDAVIACCKRKSIPVLDLFRCSNLHPNNATFRTLAYSKDGGNGVHPDETGHKIIAPMFENFLESLLLN